MKNKLRRSEKRANKSDPSKSTYSKRRKSYRDLNQYDQDRVTNSESDQDWREYEGVKSDQFDVEHEEEREKQRRAEEANPREESMA